MKRFLLALAAASAAVLFGAQASAQTTMTEPRSAGGWQGLRNGVKVNQHLLINEERCWREMRKDAETRKAKTWVRYTCSHAKWADITYQAPVVAPPVVLPPVVVPPTLGSLKVTWQPVTALDTGKPLLPGDISGYRVHYGTAPGRYTDVFEVPGDRLAHELRDLPAATYYVAVSARALWGVESARSVEVSKVIP